MDLRLKSHWQQLMDQYRKSGLTKAEFCRSQKIQSHTFYYYQKLHQSPPAQTPSKASQLFVPVVEKCNFAIRINDTLNLSFETIPDAVWMANFVRSLGETYARS